MSESRFERLCYLALAVASLALFARSLSYPFFIFDDAAHIFENPQVIGGEGFLTFWTHSLMPVPYTLWKVLAQFSATPQPWIYRLFNVSVHFLNSVLVFELLRRWPRKVTLGPAACLMGSLLFLAHPSKVEAVVWVSGAKDLLSGFFATVSLLVYFKIRKNPDSNAGVLRSVLYGAVLLAGLSKLPALAVCLVFPLLDLFEFKVGLRRTLSLSLPLLIGLAGAYWLQMVRLDADSQVYQLPLVQRISLATSTLWGSVYQLLAATQFHFDYGYSILATARAVAASPALPWVQLGLWMGVLGTSPYWKRTLIGALVFWPLLLCGVLLIPTSGLFSFGFSASSTVADRYLYLPSIGLALLAAILFEDLAQRRWPQYLVLAFVLFKGLLCFRQVGYWRSADLLLEHTVQANPSSLLAHESLATLYLVSQDPSVQARARLHEMAAKAIQELNSPVAAEE
jgi:hypothetical protein